MPAIPYLVSNMSICPIFPKWSAVLAVFFTGVFDVASAVFLMFKVYYMILFLIKDLYI